MSVGACHTELVEVQSRTLLPINYKLNAKPCLAPWLRRVTPMFCFENNPVVNKNDQDLH